MIIYIIGGILYFLYKVGKNAQEKEKAAKTTPNTTAPETEAPATPKPIRPPAYNPLEEVMREVKRKQEAIEAQKKLSSPKPAQSTIFQKSAPQKDILVHERKKATFGEGANDAPVYERDLVESEKIVRGDIRLKNEGIYRVESMEEARALADVVETSDYEFDAKQAFIGSVIFERKY